MLVAFREDTATSYCTWVASLLSGVECAARELAPVMARVVEQYSTEHSGSDKMGWSSFRSSGRQAFLRESNTSPCGKLESMVKVLQSGLRGNDFLDFHVDFRSRTKQGKQNTLGCIGKPIYHRPLSERLASGNFAEGPIKIEHKQ